VVAGVASLALASGCAGPKSQTSSSGSPGAAGHKAAYTYNSDDPSVKPVVVEKLDSVLGSVQPPKRQVRLGVVLKTLSNEYWQEVERGMKDAGKHYGVDLNVQASGTENSQSQQLSIAQTMANQDFDAYLVSPESTSNLTPALKQMRAKGVPIVNVEDARVPATTFVGPDSTLEGGRAGDYMAKQLPAGAKVAQIEGQAGSNAADLRTKSFKAAVKRAGDLELVASVPGDWDARKAYDAAREILHQHPDLAGFYANNDTMALGVAKAVADAGRTGKVMVVGTDGVPSAIKAIRRGQLDATTTPRPYSQGYWSVQAALALLDGKKLPGFILTDAQLVAKANVGDMYDAAGLQRSAPGAAG
jgi:ABC-type sugar transport system substrate-binding protein